MPEKHAASTEKEHNQDSDTDTLLSMSDTESLQEQDGKATTDSSKNSTYLTYLTYLLYFLFWATCYVIAIQLKFGTVYFLFSALFGIYFNTRTGPKNENEISAYSVFNKDCHAIDGTINPDQFDRELRYGPTAVK